MSVSRDDAANLVSRACTYLDEEKWSAFLDLCDPSFCYRVTVRSPEIKREMVWFKEDYTGLEAMFSVIPEHLRRIGTLFRHTAIGSVEAAGEDSAIIRSTFQCIHTDLEGRSRMMAAGRYIDDVGSTEQGLRLFNRETRLETRDLGVGSHVPI
jgi:methanesulfonate monooxygenase small subunit